MKSITIFTDLVKLNIESDDQVKDDFASLSINTNPNVVWAKFILLDDQPNANGAVIPQEEFSNVIRTGRFMPIKVGNGRIEPDHNFDANKPIGVITHLRHVDNYIEGLAAFWKKERPEDVKFLLEKFNNGESINISWEINYMQDVPVTVGGEEVFEKRGVVMNAATIVGMPAYSGRTPIVEMASLEDNKMEESISLEKHNEAIAALEERIEELESMLKEKQDEVASLSQFKAEVEAERARQERLSNIIEKLQNADLGLTEEELNEKASCMLDLDDDALDFMIQELIAFAMRMKNKKKKDREDSASNNIPDVTGTMNNVDLVEYLRSLDKVE